MSDDDATAARSLRELGKQLPFDKPDAERREALRSSLLVAATQGTSSAAATAATRKRWLLVGGGFAAGALAAAALAIVVISPRESQSITPPREAHARIEAPATAKLEHTVTATPSGTDEVIRIRAGTVKVAVGSGARRGDRVRMQTADAEVEATGAYEVTVVEDRLERVTVNEGTAQVTTRVDGKQQQVFLAAGQTWRPKIVTAEINLPVPPAHAVSSATHDESTGVANVAAPKADATVDGSRAATAQPNIDGPNVDASRADMSKAGATKVDTSTVSASKGDASKGDASKVATSKANTSGSTVSTKVDTSTVSASKADTSKVDTSKVDTSKADAALAKPDVATSTKSRTEQHFQAGWKLLRAGKAREAALELGAAADADASGSDALAADARYFQAVALVRAGDKAAAERVLVAFIDRAGPSAMRRGRAAVLLGKLLRDRGDKKSARAWFESALGDADPAIAAAARAHLDSLR